MATTVGLRDRLFGSFLADWGRQVEGWQAFGISFFAITAAGRRSVRHTSRAAYTLGYRRNIDGHGRRQNNEVWWHLAIGEWVSQLRMIVYGWIG